MPTTRRVLVIDVGTSGTRAAIVGSGADVTHSVYRRTPPTTPFPGLVEFDAGALAATVVAVARQVLVAGGPVDAIGVTCQRASTVVWDRTTGEPVGPGLGWQDLRTVGECIMAKAEHGLALAPNQTATKAAWLLTTYDPTRSRDLCVGTIDSWLVWVLTEGRYHVTDRSNAGVTGLMESGGVRWSEAALDAMHIRPEMMPHLIDSSGLIASATVLPGSPPITGLAGDQQASLIGQGCVRPGLAKCTFGTGAMLDMVTGTAAPPSADRRANGTFPIVAWTIGGEVTWGNEAIMLTAGTSVDWLVDDLGVLTSADESDAVAGSVPDTDGVVFVPALMGLGTPRWDYGARGALLGLTRGTTRAHVVRAVLEGIAHRGADLLEAAEADSGLTVAGLRVDGGMSVNTTFVQALADACARPIEVAPVTECTTLGAAFLAGLAAGIWPDLASIEAAWRPRRIVQPMDTGHDISRERWAEAVARSAGWIPALSALDF
mgnify:CR=1 FL=1